ncbi:MAG: biotin/lipoyl-containing protein [Anaerolineae bacterium]
MSVYYVTIRGKQYTVEVPDVRARPVRAIVDGEVVEVDVAPTPAAAAAPAPIPTPSPAPVAAPPVQPVAAPVASLSGVVEEIKAPLPGTVVSIGVSVGESVTHGQELCVLEAMKMNNPIRANQAGVIREIFVTVGQQVQHGAPLMAIEA